MIRPPLAACVVVLVLLVSGCSDDTEPVDAPVVSSEPAPESTTPGTTEPTVEPPPTEPPPPPTSAPPEPEPEPQPEPDAAPTTYDEAQARFDALGQEPQRSARFETPTGIYCVLDPAFVLGCELPSGGIPDPGYCGDGPTENVGRVLFGEGAPVPECNSDTIREPGADALALDSVASAAGIQCLAEDIGVTCLDPARTQGFFLGQQEYAVFSG